MRAVFTYPTDYTHMPHVMQWRGRELLFFCQRNSAENIWRPAFTDWNDELDPIHPLLLSTESSVCNLYAFIDSADNLVISYIALDDDQYWYLYQTTTPDLVQFSLPIKKSAAACWSGFATKDSVVTVDYNVVTIETNDTLRRYLFPQFDTVFRVFYHSADSILITAIIQNSFFTYIFKYVPGIDLTQLQLASGDEIYKSTLYGEYLIMAQLSTVDQKIEERKLFYTDTYSLTKPSDLSVIDVTDDNNHVHVYG